MYFISKNVQTNHIIYRIYTPMIDLHKIEHGNLIKYHHNNNRTEVDESTEYHNPIILQSKGPKVDFTRYTIKSNL